PIVDFRGVDVVWVVSPWVFPLAWYNQAANSLDIEADGHAITRAVTFPTASDSNLRALVVHETGHSFGLPDLYDTSDLGNARFLGTWDPMSGTAGTSAGEFIGWHLWRLGWIDDDQVTCLSPAARLDLELDALTLRGDSVIAVIPTNPSRAIVVESRRALRYDSEIARPGVLIYLVYTMDSSSAVMVGARDGTQFPTDPEGFANATLRLGERYTDWASGLTITVTASSADSDTVRFGSIDDPTEPPVDPETDPPTDETPGAVPASSEHPGSTLPATGVAADAAWLAALAMCVAGMIALARSAFRRPAATHRDNSDRR
ncbi:MAG TPA: immune inhibitor A domain-containing protein, partial [Agromyces sp.]|nr:immune inhibitor A domain-containing protein [Agromyces sp.]